MEIRSDICTRVCLLNVAPRISYTLPVLHPSTFRPKSCKTYSDRNTTGSYPRPSLPRNHPSTVEAPSLIDRNLEATQSQPDAAHSDARHTNSTKAAGKSVRCVGFSPRGRNWTTSAHSDEGGEESQESACGCDLHEVF